VAAVRITSGPLRGVELETAVGGRPRRARLFLRARRRRGGALAPAVRIVPPESLASAAEDRAA
jgi:hypothetical protein